MSELTTSFTNHDGLYLKAIGNVATGWGPWKNGFGYFGRANEDYRGDRRIKVELNLLARPNAYAQFAKDFPGDLEATGTTQFAHFLVRNGKISIMSPIEWMLDQLPTQTNQSVNFVDYGNRVDWTGNRVVWFEMYLRLCIEPPPGAPAPVVREFNTQFWQGGLPSLGRRR
jgi:hypothetical protein